MAQGEFAVWMVLSCLGILGASVPFLKAARESSVRQSVQQDEE
jgi:hypothetical protein